MRLTPGYPTKVDWHVAGPFQTYVALPVPAALLRELYVDIGLSIHHVALLIGLGDVATRKPGSSRPACRSDRHQGDAHGTDAATPR